MTFNNREEERRKRGEEERGREEKEKRKEGKRVKVTLGLLPGNSFQ